MSLFDFQLKAAGALALGVLFFYLFLSNDKAFVRNRVWLLGCLFVPWIVPLVAMPEALKRFFLDKEPEVPLVLPNETINITEKVNFMVVDKGVDWVQIGLISFGVLSLIMFLRIVISIFAIVRISQRSTKKDYRGFGLCLLKEDQITPFSFLRTIYAPKKIENHKDSKMILDHEALHCKQLHSIDILLAEIVLLLQWWNPFAWWLKKLIAQNHEYIVDSNMLKKDIQPRQYQYLLVDLVGVNSRLQLVNSFSGSLTKKRIVMMNKNKSNHIYTKIKFLPVLVLLFLGLLAFTNPQLQQVSKKDKKDKATRSIKYTYTATDSIIVDENSAEIQLYGDVTVDTGEKKTKVVVIDKSEKDDKGSHVVLSSEAKDSVKVVVVSSGSMKSVKDSIRIKVDHSNMSDEESLVIVNGEEKSIKELESIDMDQVTAIDVIKTDKSVTKYGDKGKDGVIVVKALTENDKESSISSVTQKSSANPMIMLDGKEITKEQLDALAPEKIESISVLKDESAQKLYGDKGVNGVIVIETKK